MHTTVKYLVPLLLLCLTSLTLPAQELIRNGHFGTGNTGFTSQYFYCNTHSCLYPTGGYAIGSTPNFYNPAFVGSDHTTGTGNFMILNGSETRLRVWRETVQVTPNTQYKFSAWISSMVTAFPANLNFIINRVSVGKKAAPSVQNKWERFSATWSSGTATAATIAIVDVNTTAAGNDFGLDDISFKVYAPTQMVDEVSSNKHSLTEDVMPRISSLYPNPSAGSITVTYNATTAGKVALTVFDITGRAVFSKTNEAIKGTNTYQLTLPGVTAGIYYLQISDTHQKERIEFVIQR